MTTIVKRLVKGTPLTNQELDNNFENLNVDKLERNGSIPMTGVLETPGVESTTLNGLGLYNNSGELVATLGVNGTKNAVFEGNIEIGGDGSSLDLEGGTLTVNNINVTGSIISTQLADQYKVSGNGDVFTGIGEIATDSSGSYVVVEMDVVLKLITVEGSFNVGNDVTGSQSGVTGIITKVINSNTLYVKLDNDFDEFIVGETISYASNSGVLSVVIDNGSFRPGQKLKLFGASVVASPVPPATPFASAQTVGTGSGTLYFYKIVQYRFSDGKLSSPFNLPQSFEHRFIDEFNAENNISLTLQRSGVDYGLAVYRSINVDNNFRLVAVLGPADLSNQVTSIPYIDYGTFSVTEWSTRDFTGSFTEESNLVHFPLVGPTQALQGWVTAEIDTPVSGTKNKIALTSSYTLNASGAVQFVHDNTEGLQSAIDDNRTLGIRRFNLPSGVYYSSKLKIPSNFTVFGTGQQTVIKQIPWNFDYYSDAIKPNEKGNIITTLEEFGENIFFENIDFDGNAVNNTRFFETASNYLINLNGGFNVGFNFAGIKNSVGGGIWAFQSEYLRLQNTQILNGGLSYVGLSSGNQLSPLFAGSSRFFSINNNSFENYLGAVDVSVAYIGTAVGNTIRNCGSGLLVFGSAHLLASPNLIMGPDNEFIPGPDRFDSDYNSINIVLDQGVDFFSPIYLYQETGQAAYLSSVDRPGLPGTAVELTSDLRLLTKFNNAEQLRTDYSENSGGNPIINFITENVNTSGEDRSNGYFQFKIIASNVNQIPTLSQLITDNAGILVPGEQVMGLAYRVLATTQLYTDPGERIEIGASEFSTEGPDKFVTITLNNSSEYTIFSVGDVTKIYGHSSTPDINGITGEIVEKIEQGLNRKLKIKLPDEVNLSGAVNGGATGYVTIRKTIIVAKGRVN